MGVCLTIDSVQKIKVIVFTLLFGIIYIFVFPIWFILDYIFFIPVGLLTTLLKDVEESFWIVSVIFTGISWYFFLRYINIPKRCKYKQLIKQNILIIAIATPLLWFTISTVFVINMNISFNLFYVILIILLFTILFSNYIKHCKNTD